MTPTHKKFTKEYARELLKIAEGDLKTAKVLIDHPEGRPENTFFLLQQVVEKSLKAVLCHHGAPVPLTHDLGALVSMLPSQVPHPPSVKALLTLTEFASIRRYEEGHYEYGTDEATAAYQVITKLLEWAKKAIRG